MVEGTPRPWIGAQIRLGSHVHTKGNLNGNFTVNGCVTGRFKHEGPASSEWDDDTSGILCMVRDTLCKSSAGMAAPWLPPIIIGMSNEVSGSPHGLSSRGSRHTAQVSSMSSESKAFRLIALSAPSALCPTVPELDPSSTVHWPSPCPPRDKSADSLSIRSVALESAPFVVAAAWVSSVPLVGAVDSLTSFERESSRSVIEFA